MSKIMREFKLHSFEAYDSGTNRLVLAIKPKKHDEGKWKCPKCGRYNSFNNQRCAYCGTSVLSDKK